MSVPAQEANLCPGGLLFQFAQEDEAGGQRCRTHGLIMTWSVCGRNMVTEMKRSTQEPILMSLFFFRDGSYSELPARDGNIACPRDDNRLPYLSVPMSSGCKAGLAHIEPHASSLSVKDTGKSDTHSVRSLRCCLQRRTSSNFSLGRKPSSLFKSYGTGAANEYLVALLSPDHLLAPPKTT